MYIQHSIDENQVNANQHVLNEISCLSARQLNRCPQK